MELLHDVDNQRPIQVKSCTALFGSMNTGQSMYDGKSNEHKLDPSKFSEVEEVNKFLAPGDTCSPQSSGYQKDTYYDSHDRRREPVSNCFIG